MLDSQLDDIFPAPLELHLLWLHLGDESLLEPGRDAEPTLRACFGLKEAEVPGAWRVPNAEVVFLQTEADVTTSSGSLTLGYSMGGNLVRTVWHQHTERRKRNCSHMT